MNLKLIFIYRILFIFLLSCLSGIEVQGQDVVDLNNIKIIFSHTELSLKQVLDELNALPEIHIVYSDNKEFKNIMINVQAITTVKKAIDKIKNEAPVIIIFKDNYIIVKKRELANKYGLTGRVTDAMTNELLTGVNIYIKETQHGTISDKDGNFSMQMAPGQYIIICRYMGYKQEEVPINLYNDMKITVELEESHQEIKEVDIKGTNREIESISVGRTIETIESKTINNLSTNDVNDALHGRLSGVWVTKVSGAPGDHNKVRIRGISSIFGSTDPLYVIDGTMVPVVNLKSLGIANLNVHDIESITVLKDASSSALYGYQGGNGVIMIETKKGGGKASYNAFIKKGYQQITKRYDLMNSEEFLNNLKNSDKLIGTPFYTVIHDEKKYELYPYYQDSLGNTLGYNDFQNELFNTGEINEYQLSGQGNIKTIDFYVSGNYYTHKGILINSSYDKYTFTGNFSKNFKDRASVRILYKGSHQENKNNLDNYLGNKTIFRGINYEPAYYFTPDSFLRKSERLFFNNTTYRSIKDLSEFRITPKYLYNKPEKKKIESNNTLSAHGYIKINNSLSLRTTHSLAFRNYLYSSNFPKYNRGDFETPEKLMYSNENVIIISQQYELNFDKKINDHVINSFVRYRNYNDNIYWNIDSMLNIEYNQYSLENDIYIRGSQSIYGTNGSVIRAMNSYIAGISYNYKRKYFVSCILNSNNLKEGLYVDQKDIFPSVAVDWDISKEKILKMPLWVNAFHVYTNWGKSGNYPLNSLSTDLFYYRNTYNANDNNVTGFEISNLANHGLKHEEVTEFNYGVKISIFNKSINISGDYFTREFSDLFIKRETPIYYGGGSTFQNIGKMDNKGIELNLEIVPFNRHDLYWSFKFGFSHNSQVIKSLNDSIPISFNNTDLLYPEFYAKVKETLGDITGFSYQGKWNEAIHGTKEGEMPRYINVSGLAYLKSDTLDPDMLTNNDKVIIGNSIPEFTCNWINTFEYKNFSVEMLWYGVFGMNKYNATKAATYITGINSGVRALIDDTLSCLGNEAIYQSSYFVEDASFFRLKTLRFSYAQPKKIMSKIGITYTLSLENLITITKYSGYDPEATIYTNNNFTDNAIDRGAYPSPRGFFFSINLNF